jgi:hypothetical protein
MFTISVLHPLSIAFLSICTLQRKQKQQNDGAPCSGFCAHGYMPAAKAGQNDLASFLLFVIHKLGPTTIPLLYTFPHRVLYEMLLLALSDVGSFWKECVRVGPVAVQGMSTAKSR